MTKQVYYDRYDVMVDAETGEILNLPICGCPYGPDETGYTCIYKKVWVDDGSPTHVATDLLDW